MADAQTPLEGNYQISINKDLSGLCSPVALRQMFLPRMKIAAPAVLVDPAPGRPVNLGLGACHPIKKSSLRNQQDGCWRAKSLAKNSVCAAGRKSSSVNVLALFPPINVTPHEVIRIGAHVGICLDEPGRHFAPTFSRAGAAHIDLVDMDRGSGNTVIVFNRGAGGRRRPFRRWKRLCFGHPLPKHHIGFAYHSNLLLAVATGA